MPKEIILNSIFTKTSFNSLLNKDKSSYVDRYIESIRRFIGNRNMTNKKAIEKLYLYLEENYRNEYFFKNTIKNEILIKEHNLYKTIAFTELPIGKSISDYLMINGEANVYEIKTSLDTFNRLDSQIENYYKAFKYVNLIIDESKFKDSIKSISNKDVGIYVLKKDNTIEKYRENRSVNKYLEHEVLFKLLWKKEYENIIIEKFNKLPDVSDFVYPLECFKLVKKINIDEFHYLAINQIKQRKNKESLDLFHNKIPYELRFIMYFLLEKEEEYEKLQDFLKMNWRDMHVFSNN